MSLRVGVYATQTVHRLCQCKVKSPLKPTFQALAGRAYRANTAFVRHHPFKPGWEIRRCLDCGSEWAVDSSLLTT